MSKVELTDIILAAMHFRDGSVEHVRKYTTCRAVDSLGRRVCVEYGDVDFAVGLLAAEGLITREWGSTVRQVEVLRLTDRGRQAARAAARRLGRRGRAVARYAAMESEISKIIELLERNGVVEKRGDYYKTTLF